MTQRERLLAIGVGVVVGLFGMQYALSSLSGKIQAKQDLVDAARTQRDGLARVAITGESAARKINILKAKSLPTEKEALTAQYRNWLLKVAEEAGMQGIDIVLPERPVNVANTEAFVAYNFTLHGECRTDKSIELLAAFYDADYLHRIKNMKLAYTKVPDVLDVVIESQALALRDAEPKQESSGQSSGRLTKSVDEYKQIILNRNPFSRPNQPPRFAGENKFEIPRGERWSQILDTQDAENHEVQLEIVSASDAPEGLSLSGKTFSWTPNENGEYEVLVRATDSGWPSLSTEQKLTLKVVDPAKPEIPVETPKFDVATQAFVSAMLSGRSGPEAWIRSRTEGKTLYLSEGSDFEIGSVKAKVVGINLNEDFMELESDGRRWTIGMDTSLAEAFAKSRID